MIEMILAAFLLAESTPDATSSIEPLVAMLTGSGGALVAMGAWVKTLLADKKEMVDRHKEKDEQLTGITREAIACIQASVSRGSDSDAFRERIETLLERIDAKLDNVA